ncbi:DUF3800 domain-containing protein [Magnetospirillum sp. UT-4]|uniref:DUF3800 domain-containing protein n=1 Tax=Magnetospirillum sp. UT-4 TaxID=2681467 RepID=UPI00137C8B86|nr:DUF3800 domain-containing protein [Magnetospirillum sp. UT-4]CAA7621629.1 conserved hypothetical protein [Magnetospirillum sp. UT-4]
MEMSPYIVYVDESGDRGLGNINPAAPVFLLCAALYEREGYLTREMPSLGRLKFAFWKHDNVILHSYRIRRKIGPFSAFSDPDVARLFAQEVGTFFRRSECTLIAAAIHKERLRQAYARPVDPYLLAVQFIAERVWGAVYDRGGRDRETVFVFESRGRREDDDIRKWFTAVCGGNNMMKRPFPFSIEFAPKEANLAGLQVADLAAYPIAKYVETGNGERLDWLAVSTRIRRAPTGELDRWGLKIFPQS